MTPATPLSRTEKAYFDTIKQVARSARPQDLVLSRMLYEGQDVAVITQRVLSSGSGEVAGYQPLAMLVTDELVARLRTVEGEAARPTDPAGLEGPA